MSGPKLRIGALDAAIVLREDGRREVFIPRVSGGREPPATAVAVEALFWALNDPEMMEGIVTAMIDACEAGPPLTN